MCDVTIENVAGNRGVIHLRFPPNTPDHQGKILHALARNDFGEFDHFEFRVTGYTVWLFRYVAKADVCLSLTVPDKASLSLTLFLKGNLTYRLDGKESYVGKEGHFNMNYLPPLQVDFLLKKDEEYVVTGVEYKAFFLENAGKLPIEITELLKGLKAHSPSWLADSGPEQSKEIKEIGVVLSKGFMEGNLETSLELKSNVIRLALLAAGQLTVSRNPEQLQFQKIHDYITEQHGIHLDVEKLMSKFHIGKTRLRFGFKKYYGKTAADYILYSKIEEADRLLKDFSLEIKEVAIRVGYSNVSNFSSAYVKVRGIAPGKARKKMVKGKK